MAIRGIDKLVDQIIHTDTKNKLEKIRKYLKKIKYCIFFLNMVYYIYELRWSVFGSHLGKSDASGLLF